MQPEKSKTPLLCFSNFNGDHLEGDNMNKAQKKKVIKLRKEGLGYKRIANKIDGANKYNVRDFIKTKWFKINHSKLVDLNTKKPYDLSDIEKDYGEARCKYCGESFKKKTGHQVYCSDNCRIKYYKKPESTYIKTCKHCGGKFKTKSTQQIYCSKQCRIDFHNHKNRKGPENCIVCGKKLPKRRVKYCSNKCREEHKHNKYNHTCEWCGTNFSSAHKDSKFCGMNCQKEWLTKKISFEKNQKELEKIFKNKFEEKFPNFKYHSEYTGADDYFKMECRKCGHIQERNAQCVRQSRDIEMICDRNERRQKLVKKINKILNSIKRIARKRKRKLVRKEIKSLRRIKKNHKHYKQCSECGRHYFTTRINSSTCSSKCQKKRNNRLKELRRRNMLKTNGKINRDISLSSLIEKDNSICQLCGKPIDEEDFNYTDEGHFIAGPKYPSIDHIIPVAKGGTHTIDNVQLAHRDCNYNKSDESLFELEDNKLKISI
jgi:hypothetical protein